MPNNRSFSTTCDSGLVAELNARVDAEKEKEFEWWSEALADVTAIFESDERREARAALEAERLRRREEGVYLSSKDAMLRFHLEQVLAERGWNRRYKPVPAGHASVPGRRWGVSPGDTRTGDGEGRLACNVPPKLWEQVRRAAYWESKPHVQELQAWYHRFGDGPGRADREGGVVAALIYISMALGGGPRREDLKRRDELRGKIVTTGDILRLAARKATSSNSAT